MSPLRCVEQILHQFNLNFKEILEEKQNPEAAAK